MEQLTLEGGSLSSILNPDGTGLSESGKILRKSVRSNDRLFKYEQKTFDDNVDTSSKTESVLNNIQAASDKYSDEGDDNYRHDTVRDVNWTVTIIANSIKVVSAVLTILATDQTERKDDDYDKAIGTLLSIGASVLKVAGEKILEAYNSQQIDSVDRLGVAAPTSDILDLNLPDADSEEELLRKQKVAEFVSKLTPEQLKSQQEKVQDHVRKQAEEQNLNESRHHYSWLRPWSTMVCHSWSLLLQAR